MKKQITLLFLLFASGLVVGMEENKKPKVEEINLEVAEPLSLREQSILQTIKMIQEGKVSLDHLRTILPEMKTFIRYLILNKFDHQPFDPKNLIPVLTYLLGDAQISDRSATMLSNLFTYLPGSMNVAIKKLLFNAYEAKIRAHVLISLVAANHVAFDAAAKKEIITTINQWLEYSKVLKRCLQKNFDLSEPIIHLPQLYFNAQSLIKNFGNDLRAQSLKDMLFLQEPRNIVFVGAVIGDSAIEEIILNHSTPTLIDLQSLVPAFLINNQQLYNAIVGLIAMNNIVGDKAHIISFLHSAIREFIHIAQLLARDIPEMHVIWNKIKKNIYLEHLERVLHALENNPTITDDLLAILAAEYPYFKL